MGRGPPWGEGGGRRDPVALAIEAAAIEKRVREWRGGGLKQSWQAERGVGGTNLKSENNIIFMD